MNQQKKFCVLDLTSTSQGFGVTTLQVTEKYNKFILYYS